MKNNEQIVTAAILQNRSAFEFGSAEMRTNAMIATLGAVQKDGLALEQSSDEIKDNETIVIAALKQNWEALKLAGEEMKNNEAIRELPKREMLQRELAM